MATTLIQNTFANTYRDDFRDSDHYHRILFNGGRAVQPRELTQMQTIIQREMERFGNNIFKDGGAVNPVHNVLIDNNYSFVKLQGETTLDSASLVGTVFEGTSGVKAKVLKTVSAVDSDPATLYVQYIYGSGISSYSTFQAGETINNGTDSFTVQTTNTTVNPAIGVGTKASVGQGDFFAAGHFVFAESQEIILNKYSPNASAVLGFKVIEDIVTESDDIGLYDNSKGNPNLTAPGAHRYRIRLILIDQADVAATDTFIYVCNVVNGIVEELNTGRDDYSKILDLLAERTREESGSYVVKPFTAFFETDSDDAYLKLNIADGIGYINGYRAAPGPQKIRVAKPTTTETFNNEAVPANYGNFINVTSIKGLPNIGTYEKWNLRDNATYASGNTIGTLRIRAVTENAGNYRFYVFDLKMHTGKNFRDVRSIGTSSVRNAQLVLENGVAVIKEANNNNVFFALSKTRPSSIGNDHTYDVIRYASGTVSSNQTTISNAGSSEAWANTGQWIVTRGDTGAIVTPSSVSVSEPNAVINTTGIGDGVTLEVMAIVQKGAGSPVPYKTKTLTETTVTADVITDSDGTYVDLGKSDIWEVLRVRTTDSDGTDVSSRFYLDNGQRDNFYDHGRMVLAPGQSDPGTDVFVRFKYFAHSGTGDFFAVNSYPVGSGANQITYAEIPSYRQRNGDRIDLRDVLDFRGTIDNTGAAYSGTGGIVADLPANTDLVTIDPTYYVPRKDKLTIEQTGSFQYIEGAPSFDAKYPKVPDGSLELYQISLNPNTLDNKDLITRYIDNRRYTMRDIGKLHKKINKVEELATLSLLDIAASTLEVLDSNGLSRTKAGFLTDDFKDHRAANVDDLEYRASIDPTAGIMRPGYREKNIPLVFDSADGSISNTVLLGDNIMLSYTETLMAQQTQASRIHNVNPYTVINYNGTLTLSPNSDESRDPQTISLRTNGQSEISIETFLNNVLGTQDTQNVLSTISNNPEFGGREEFIRNNISLQNANNFTSQGSLAAALTTLPPSVGQILASVFDRISPTWREYAWGWAGIDSRETEEKLLNGGIGSTNEQTFGRFATRLFIPRIRAREVRFRASGLLPNTKHYPFFDGVRVDSYCVQFSRIGVDFGPVDRGVWRWARRGDWWTWPSFGGRLFRRYAWQYWHPHWDATQPTSNQAALISNDNGVIEGSFFIPNDDNLQFFAGARVFSLFDVTAEDVENSTSRCYATYTVEGTNPVNFERIPDPVQQIRQRRRGLYGLFRFDPIAQTFRVNNPEGAFVTKIGVYFQSKDTLNNIPVDCEIRPVVNGYPSSDTIVANGFKQLSPSDVNVSSNASSVTYFEFDNPVYLIGGGTEYAMILRAATDAYNVWISHVGDFVLGTTDKKITKQPSIGSFFKSQNGSTWEASQWDDLKFDIYRANFATSGVAVFHNDKLHPKLLVPNPILFDSGDATVRIIDPNHGLMVNDVIQLHNIDSDANYPLTNINSIVGDRTITKVDGSGFTFEADSAATASTRTGGYGVYTADNVLMDTIYLSMETENPPTTTVSYKGKFMSGKSFAGAETPYALESTYGHDLAPFEEYNFDAPRMVASEELEGVGGNPTHSTYIKATLNSGSTWVSPVISATRCSITAMNNVIDRPDSSSTTNYNVPISYIAETDPFGGSSLAKYVTKPVTLEEAAVGLKIILAANRPNGTYFDIYYKTITSDGSLNDTNWILATADNTVQTDENPNRFREYRYTIGGEGGFLDAFTTFQVKIVMNSTNSSKVPVFRDFRAIALTV